MPPRCALSARSVHSFLLDVWQRRCPLRTRHTEPRRTPLCCKCVLLCDVDRWVCGVDGPDGLPHPGPAAAPRETHEGAGEPAQKLGGVRPAVRVREEGAAVHTAQPEHSFAAKGTRVRGAAQRVGPHSRRYPTSGGPKGPMGVRPRGRMGGGGGGGGRGSFEATGLGHTPRARGGATSRSTGGLMTA